MIQLSSSPHIASKIKTTHVMWADGLGRDSFWNPRAAYDLRERRHGSRKRMAFQQNHKEKAKRGRRLGCDNRPLVGLGVAAHPAPLADNLGLLLCDHRGQAAFRRTRLKRLEPGFDRPRLFVRQFPRRDGKLLDKPPSRRDKLGDNSFHIKAGRRSHKRDDYGRRH